MGIQEFFGIKKKDDTEKLELEQARERIEEHRLNEELKKTQTQRERIELKEKISENKRYVHEHSFLGRVQKKISAKLSEAQKVRVKIPRAKRARAYFVRQEIPVRKVEHPSFMPRESNLPPMPDLLGGGGKIPDLLGRSKAPKMADLLGIGHKRRSGRRTNIFRLY